MIFDYASFYRKYPNKYFIETGTFVGEGIKRAIQAGVFEKYITIEFSRHYTLHAKEQLKDSPVFQNISFFTCDSAICLYPIIKDINEQMTFWLDAHWIDVVQEKTIYKTTLIHELNWIAQHEIKTHTLLIDNISYFTYWSITKEEVLNLIYKINPCYDVSYRMYTEDNIGDGIIIAEIKAQEA